MSRARPEMLVGFLCFVPFIIAVLLLSAFVGGETANFNTLAIFGFIFLFSIVPALAAQKYNKHIPWFDSPDRKDWLWVPIGFGAMMGASLFIAPLFGGNVGILIALGIGGIALGAQLYYTKSIFIIILTHFLYNMTAILFSGAFTNSVFYVPKFAFDGINTGDLLQQIGLQLIGPALAEEFMRVSLAIGTTLLLVRNSAVGVTVASILWSISHAVIAYRV